MSRRSCGKRSHCSLPSCRGTSSSSERLHAGGAAVMGDPTQIHQVLMNLLTNAVQAMPSGGTLRVSLDRIHLRGTTRCNDGLHRGTGVCSNGSFGFRQRDPCRDLRKDVRSVLHHQGSRCRDWPRPFAGARHRDRARRRHRRRDHCRQGKRVQGIPATGRRCRRAEQAEKAPGAQDGGGRDEAGSWS